MISEPGKACANRSIGEDWMLLEIGATVLDGVPNYTLTRDALSLETPGGKTILLASTPEYRKANLPTEDEEKLLSKNYKDISKQVKDAFKKKG